MENGSSLTPHAQALRRRMTDEEKHLWYDWLKKLPQTVHRQKVIGRYIVDFYCPSAKLVIELDGAQHGRPQDMEKDRERDAYLQSRGLTIVRYTNKQINLEFDNVCADIRRRIESNRT